MEISIGRNRNERKLEREGQEGAVERKETDR